MLDKDFIKKLKAKKEALTNEKVRLEVELETLNKKIEEVEGQLQEKYGEVCIEKLLDFLERMIAVGQSILNKDNKGE